MNVKIGKVTSYITLALIVVSVLAGILPILVPVNAQQGTITLSSNVFNPDKVVVVQVTGDFGDGPVKLMVLDSSGATVDLTLKGGSSGIYFYAYKIGPGKYLAYLGGDNVDLSANPSTPLVSEYDAIAKISGGYSDGDTFTVMVAGTDIGATLTYGTVDSTLTVDLADKYLPYRRLDVVIPLVIVDPDLDHDPTDFDTIDGSKVDVTIKLIKAEGGEVTLSLTLNDLGIQDITEVGPNTGKFVADVSLEDINDLLKQQQNGRAVFKDDKLLISVKPKSDLQGDFSDVYSGSDKVTAVYRAPSVQIIATSQKLKIRIISPDDNVNPRATDTLDCQDMNDDSLPDTEVYVKVGGSPYTFACSDFLETDVNTGVFEKTLPVYWGTSASVTSTSVTYPTSASSVSIYAYYRMKTLRDPGYNVNATGSGSYVPVTAELSLIKATVKSIILSVRDQDINTRSGSVEYLTADYATSGVFDLYLKYPYTTPVTLARISLKDVYGNPVSVKGTPAATDLISFVETDFNTGEFVVKIDTTKLNVDPGSTYTLEYVDSTGPDSVITLPVTISALSISLDRTEYPVNRNGIKVYVTYVNDAYNNDPSLRESVSVTATITRVDGVTENLGTYQLSETDVDSGVFTGSITIGSSYFTTPQIIDSTLKVTGPDGSLTVTAKIRAHDASIEVDKTIVKWGDTIKVTVKDPDANTNSKSSDSVSISIAGQTKSCYETGANTGVFTCEFTVSWDEQLFRNIEPGTTITVKYSDNTPIMSPTATSWKIVPYAATFKIATYTGSLGVETAEEGYVGALEEFDVVVTDPDLNRYVNRADNPTTDAYVSDVIAVSFEGIYTTPTYSVSETGADTSVFSLEEATGYKLSLVKALMDANILPATPTPRERAEVMAQYIGKKVTISYIDETDATGVRSIVTKNFVIKAWDATIATDKSAINLGEWLTINITNKDIAGTTTPEYKMVVVKSDSYPTGLMFYLEEVQPGVFQLKIQVVGVNDWIPGAKQIPAKLGDQITIEYVDPITADGRAYVAFDKTVSVGVYAEKPGKAEKVAFVDVSTGQSITPKVGKEVFITVTLKNTDIVERTMTIIVVVRDPNGVAVARFAGAATLGAGKSTDLSFGWTPIVSGSHSVEIYIVKSLADRTPMGEAASFSATVAA